MPTPLAHLSPVDVSDYVRDHVFGTASSAADVDPAVARHSVGIELEWLTGAGAADRRLALDQAEAVLHEVAPLPAGGRLTLEPGGQIELSSARFDTLEDALAGTATDLFALDQACRARDIHLIAMGADPLRPPERILEAPRYAAMEAFFDAEGRHGRAMMCNTASIQVNLGLGDEDAMAARWHLANALGPTLSACFANSPFRDGQPSGWLSTRLHAWWHLDPSRAEPPCTDADPVGCWTDYALDARVMLIRTGIDASEGADSSAVERPDPVADRVADAAPAWTPLVEALTFREWLHRGHELGWPTLDDFAYHLTTLFPPVRPRGWFEVRYIDALPTPFWHVAAAVLAAVLDDGDARAEALDAVTGTTDLWVDAAQLGLVHPELGPAGRRVFDVAIEALGRRQGDSATVELVGRYLERWVARQRCPADDLLDAWRRDGTVIPPETSPMAAVSPVWAVSHR